MSTVQRQNEETSEFDTDDDIPMEDVVLPPSLSSPQTDEDGLSDLLDEGELPVSWKGVEASRARRDALKDIEEDETGESPWDSLLEDLAEVGGEELEDETEVVNLVSREREPTGVYASPSFRRLLTHSPLSHLTPEQLQVIDSKKKLPEEAYSILGTVTLTTLGPCTDGPSALWQHLVALKSQDQKRARLSHSIIKSLLGNRNYLDVLDQNRQWVTWEEREGEKKDYMPARLSSSGIGRCTEYRVAKQETGHSYTIQGRDVARYYRCLSKAHKVTQSRHSELHDFFLQKSQYITIGGAVTPEEKKAQAQAKMFLRRNIGSVNSGGRFANPMTKIQRCVRPYMRYQGEEMVAIDLVRAWPSFLFELAAREWELPKKEIRWLFDARQGLDKNDLLKWMNDPAGAWSHPHIERAFATHAPTFLRIFRRHRKELKRAIHKLWSDRETEVMTGLIQHLRSLGFDPWLIAWEYDGLRVLRAMGAVICAAANTYLDSVSDGWFQAKVKRPEDEAGTTTVETKVATRTAHLPAPKKIGGIWGRLDVLTSQDIARMEVAEKRALRAEKRNLN